MLVTLAMLAAASPSPSTAAIILNEVCLPAIAERKPVAELAARLKMVPMPPKSVGATANDKVWRLGAVVPVYVVAWVDGSCSTYIERGSTDELRTATEWAISTRPEGFVRGSDVKIDALKIRRTVYCAPGGGQQLLVASITTPEPGARRVRPLSSTVYRRAGSSPLCSADAGPEIYRSTMAIPAGL